MRHGGKTSWRLQELASERPLLAVPRPLLPVFLYVLPHTLGPGSPPPGRSTRPSGFCLKGGSSPREPCYPLRRHLASVTHCRSSASPIPLGANGHLNRLLHHWQGGLALLPIPALAAPPQPWYLPGVYSGLSAPGSPCLPPALLWPTYSASRQLGPSPSRAGARVNPSWPAIFLYSPAGL